MAVDEFYRNKTNFLTEVGSKKVADV